MPTVNAEFSQTFSNIRVRVCAINKGASRCCNYPEGGSMHSRISTILFWLISIAVLEPGMRGQSKVSREPVARIGDQTIYEEDLLPSIGGQLFQLKNQEYELKSKELEDLVNQKLLESAAKSKGLSTDAFLEQTVYRNLPPPTPSEVESYYLAQKDQINRPLSEVKSQMEQALTEARRQRARQDYLDGLRQKSSVAILLPHPRIDVAPDPARLRGNPDAPVTIVEFSDFQCPFCRAAEPTIKEVLDKYKDKVRFSYRDFPIERIHSQAKQAAEASRCAREQGKFWEYHDLLYANQAKLDQAGLTEHARTVALDVDRFSACLVSGKFKALVDNDFQAGIRAGVSGTPAFYINGIFLSGAQPVSAFEKIIDAELAAAESNKVDSSGLR
jgi:predicted DsbA family dithiol-disulfide isomerase